jgi:hypothetical protein
VLDQFAALSPDLTSSVSGLLADLAHVRQGRSRCLRCCPRVAAITLGRPPYRARGGHAHDSGVRLSDLANLYDLRAWIRALVLEAGSRLNRSCLLDRRDVVPCAAAGHQEPERLAHACSPPLPADHRSGCVPAQTPPLNPIAARPHVSRVLSRVGGADHAVTPQAPWTGSGWRGYSYGGFGGGHPHFHRQAPRRVVGRSWLYTVPAWRTATRTFGSYPLPWRFFRLARSSRCPLV